MRHSAAISGDGKLYLFGNGNWGVLGQGTETDARFDSPQLVEYFTKRGRPLTKEEINKLIEDDRRQREDEEAKKRADEEAERRRIARLMEEIGRAHV